MAGGFLDIAGTPSVKATQAANGVAVRSTTGEARTERSRFTAAEAQFIAARDSFYLATVSETGWPYVQHRGGPPVFCASSTIRRSLSRIFAVTGNTSALATSPRTIASRYC